MLGWGGRKRPLSAGRERYIHRMTEGAAAIVQQDGHLWVGYPSDGLVDTGVVPAAGSEIRVYYDRWSVTAPGQDEPTHSGNITHSTAGRYEDSFSVTA